MARRRAKNLQPTPSDPSVIAEAIAKAVVDGDVVNFRQIFGGLSPARPDTVETLADPKYSYLLPSSTQKQTPDFQTALRAVRSPDTWKHIEGELAAKRPPQLPSELLLSLGDHAVAQGKYTSAAQAYEVLRVRKDIQSRFFEAGRAALGERDATRSVAAYLIGLGLGYDYAAFPEPMPMVPEFPRRALILHAEAPRRPEDVIPFREPEVFLRLAIEYLLGEPDHADEICEAPMETRVAFFAELVRQRDPEWDAFVKRFAEAAALEKEWNDRLREMMAGDQNLRMYSQDIAEQLGEDPRRVPEILLGRAIPNGEWWQYLKELAYQHPPAALFVSRRMLGRVEFIAPRLRLDNPALAPIGLDATARLLAEKPPAAASTAQ